MRLFSMIFITATSFASMTTLAHSEVANPVVKARMAAMSDIGASMKTLGKMVKGETDFDAMAAQAAVDTVAARAEAAPELFEPKETDPESEALPAIWDNWDDFVTKAEALQTTAEGITITAAADLGPAMGQLGDACKACHSKYKE
ncbi:cytochrome c [Sagittula sp. NFXS13]|uniref:c-type cytochrome n=1 Tax=Sagittula sp. NFXS13 TaxID=2819095 RepID=UPI0032DECBA7